MIKRVLFLSLLLVTFPSWSQQLTQSIRGTVTDEASQAPIPFATVVIVKSNPLLGAQADAYGNFQIDSVPIGRVSVEVSAIGYESRILEDILVSSMKMVQLDVGLTEQIKRKRVVKVKAKAKKDKPLNNMTSASGRMFSVEEAKKYAGGFDDPARLASSFAGVSSTSTGNNGIVIRGNAPKGLLWRLEGIEISNPNHFADLDAFGGGGLTALSSYVLANSDFLTSAFTAEYGNALSGVFDIKMRKGNTQEHEHSFEIGAIGTDIASEGPLSKKKNSSYLFNYRYATLGLISPFLPEDAGGVKYQDLSFKFHFKTKKMGTIVLWGLGALDGSGSEPSTDSSEWITKYDFEEGDVIQNMGAIGLSHKYFLNKKTFIKTSLASSGNGLDLEYKKTDLANNTSHDFEKIESGLWNYTLQSFVNTKWSKKHVNRTGFSANILNYNLDIRNADGIGGSLNSIVDERGSSELFRFFSSSKFTVHPKFWFTTGIHFQLFSLSNNYSVEPRIGFKWTATKKDKIGFAYGKHSRLERLNFYFVKGQNGELVNEDLEMNKAHHFVLSYSRSLGKVTKLTIEPYYQFLYDVPIISNSSISLLNMNSDFYFNQALVNSGEGKNKGVDITLEQYLKKGMYYMATTSIYSSKYKAGDNEWRNTRYARGFISNFLIGKEWTVGKNKNNLLGSNIKVTYQGGQRYTPLDEVATANNGDIVEDESRLFELQRDPIINAHLTLNYRKNRKKFSSIWSLKILNVTGTKDFYGYEYNLQESKAQFSEEVLFIPNLSYKIEF